MVKQTKLFVMIVGKQFLLQKCINMIHKTRVKNVVVYGLVLQLIYVLLKAKKNALHPIPLYSPEIFFKVLCVCLIEERHRGWLEGEQIMGVLLIFG